MDTELLTYRIALKNLKDVGPSLARQLLDAFHHDPATIFNSLQDDPLGRQLPDSLRSQIESGEWRKYAEKEINFIQKQGIRALWFEDADYPFRLAQCPDAPLMLYQKGQAELNADKVIAIVGTRKMTEYGRAATEELTALLSQYLPGSMIISGLAYGIDACAHRGALKGNLPTAAVLAHGLDQIYPAAHRSLANEMLENGALLSEMESGIQPEGYRFLQRNRIVAGLSDVCVVIESGERGGSLSTARLARDYNREVYALPGRWSDICSKGCNQLIYHNIASILPSLEEFVLELADMPVPLKSNTRKKKKDRGPELWPDAASDSQKAPIILPENEKEIFQLFSGGKDYCLEELAAIHSHQHGLFISTGELMAGLFQLEIKRLIVSLPGNLYRLA